MLIFPRWHVRSLSRSGVSCAEQIFTISSPWKSKHDETQVQEFERKFLLSEMYISHSMLTIRLYFSLNLWCINLHYISCCLPCASYGKITKWWEMYGQTLKIKKNGTYLPSSEDDNKILNSAHSQAIGPNSTRNLWVTCSDYHFGIKE